MQTEVNQNNDNQARPENESNESNDLNDSDSDSEPTITIVNDDMNCTEAIEKALEDVKLTDEDDNLPSPQIATFSDETPDVHVGLTHVDLPYNVLPLVEQYGPGQRGCIATMEFAAPDIIQTDRALVYVSYDIDPSDKDGQKFFTGSKAGHSILPETLSHLNGAPLAAITGLLIRDYEKHALAFLRTDIGLHGKVNVKKYSSPAQIYPALVDTYFGDFDKEKMDRWNLKTVGMLYGIVQINAIAGIIPISNHIYGYGLYAGSVFFNHSCAPNAVRVVTPGSVTIHALCEIEKGDEITIAYGECPVDLLSMDMIRTFHVSMGLDEGCFCTTCNMVEEAEGKILDAHGGDSTAERIVNVDLSLMWVTATNHALESDEKFRAYVMSMIQTPGQDSGAAAACAIRKEYSHYFIPVFKAPNGNGGKANTAYLPDLAFVLGDLYCSSTIHVNGQKPKDMEWWPKIFIETLQESTMNLPHSLDKALLSRCYTSILCCGMRKEYDDKAQKRDADVFVSNWIAIRHMHMTRYGHTGHLIVPQKTYKILADTALRLSKHIKQYEECLLQQDLRNSEEKGLAVTQESIDKTILEETGSNNSDLNESSK